MDGLILRTSKKRWACNGDGSSHHNHAEGCAEDIYEGDQYVECMWSTPAYQSGERVSLECAQEFYGWDSAELEPDFPPTVDA